MSAQRGTQMNRESYIFQVRYGQRPVVFVPSSAAFDEVADWLSAFRVVRVDDLTEVYFGYQENPLNEVMAERGFAGQPT